MARPKSYDPDQGWNALYQLAEQYFIANGNLLIPGDYTSEGRRLGAWIGTQRTDYKKQTNPFFTQNRIDRLNAIGMVWDVKEFRWQFMYQELQRYADSYGTVRVPQSYSIPEGEKLGIWLNKVRMDYKNGSLSEARQAMLEQIGVIWEPEILRRGEWDVKYDLLKNYVESNGGCPQGDYVTERGVKLGLWLNNQKSNYKQGVLLPERLDKLKELGVVWDILENNWEIRYQQAREYHLKHGHLCLFSQRGTEIPDGLASWLSMQRQKYKSGELSRERIGKLEQSGMIWDVRESLWEEKYQQAKEYYFRHGHLRVLKDNGSPEERRLGSWISGQRKNYMKGQNPLFTSERIRRLEEIGMVWDASVDSAAIWEEWYKKAEEYYVIHNHLRPPPGKLCTWIQAQRGAKKGKRGKLSKEQIRRLEQIGISWSPIEEDWQTMFWHAKEYYQIHQMLNIPCTYVTDDGIQLGIWISRQRTGYKNYRAGKKGGGRNVITPEHIKLLNDIGMIWDGATVMSSTSFQEKALLFYLKKHFKKVGKLDKWQALGIELDIYIPSIKTAIEYDGCKWHADTVETDEKKGRICKDNGIRLVRLREPGLPKISQCDLVIELEALGDDAFEHAIADLFAYLKLPVTDCDIAGDRPRILVTYKDYTARKWDRLYKEVYKYYNKHGNLSVPSSARSSSGISIANWINSQREAYRNSELTALQVKKLEEIGMSWAPFEDQWQRLYSLAEAYSKQYGHLMIPHDYKTADDETLGSWLAIQRSKYRLGEQTPRRIRMLEKLGIVWNPVKNRQEHYMLAAKRYFDKNGDLNIPVQLITEDNLRLGEWLCEQRSLYKAGKLGKERKRTLEEWGIQWNVFQDRWDEMFTVAKAYFQEHGNLWVSPSYVSPDGTRLGGWISQQRQKLDGRGRHSILTADQKSRLDEIGMVWDPYTLKWLNKYKLAEAFYKEHGHLNIPVAFITEDGAKLGMWIASQRQALRGNPNFVMTPERKQLLDAVGMNWELKFTKPNARCRPDLNGV